MNRYKNKPHHWDGKEDPLEYSKRVVARHKRLNERLNQRLLREERERQRGVMI